LVEPELTLVGPLSVTEGAVPLLWHEVQIELLFPEKPEMPLLVALAGTEQTIASIMTLVSNHGDTTFLLMPDSPDDVWLSPSAVRCNGELGSSASLPAAFLEQQKPMGTAIFISPAPARPEGDSASSTGNTSYRAWRSAGRQI
jgi:hypothetical protein